MSSPAFPLPLIYENLEGKRLRLTSPFTFREKGDEQGDFVYVPIGFVCDGQSYPRALRFIDHPQGKGLRAAVIHDYLYWLNGHLCPYTNRKYSRKTSDTIFKKALLASGINPLSSEIRYRMVRLFGRIFWNIQSELIPNKYASLHIH